MDQRQRMQSRKQPYPPQLSTQSAPTSPTSSSFQSSSSTSSTASSAAGAARNQPSMIQTQPQQQGLAAPLPSPSSNEAPSYFSQQAPRSHPSPEQQPHQQRIPPHENAYMGQRGGSNGGAPETAPFLQDFSLIKEAATRAQMACLTRDLGDVGL